MIQLDTARLAMRNFQAGDWETLHEMIVEYENSALATFDETWPTSEEEIKKVTAWFASGDIYLAVCLKHTGDFIGFVALNPEHDPDQKVYNVGTIFRANYRGKGYATEACRAIVEFAFSTFHADRVVSGTAAANLASCKLLAGLGFKKTSESTASFRNGPDGRPIEFLGNSYALTHDKWIAAGGKP